MGKASHKTNLQRTRESFKAILTAQNELVIGARGKVAAIYHVVPALFHKLPMVSKSDLFGFV